MKKDAELIAVYGRRGCGKTTKVKALIKDRPRVVVFDPRAEYRTGFRRCASVADVLAAIKRCYGRFHLAYVPREGYEPQALHNLAAVLTKVQEPYKQERDARKLTLVVEEMDLSFPVTALPAELSGMRRLCNQGRHDGIDVIGVTQRPATISTIFRGNAAVTYIFSLDWHSDRTTITSMIGPGYDLLGLEPHQYLERRGGKVTAGKNPPLRKKT